MGGCSKILGIQHPENRNRWYMEILDTLRIETALSNSQLYENSVLTFVILPPLKLANLFRESVRTLDVRWTVKRLVAGTFFLHLEEKKRKKNDTSVKNDV